MATSEAANDTAAQHARSLRLPFVSLDHDAADDALFQGLNLETLVRFNCVPYARFGPRLVLAFAPPLTLERISEAEFAMGRPIDAVIATAQDVAEALRRKRGGEMMLDKAREGLASDLDVAEDEEAKIVDLDALAAESPIVRLVDSLLLGAIERRASDIHIETKDRAVLAKYRIDGALYEATAPVERRHAETIVSRI